MTWIAPPIDRQPEPPIGDERTLLEGWLDFHRQTLLLKCAGLTAGQLATAGVASSRLTLLGLVRHMAEVEAGWFREYVAGERVDYPYSTRERPEADFDVTGADAAADMATFHREVALARVAVAGRSLETTIESRDGTPTRNLRWVYLHMIEEYARHNGHADLIRESIDGVTGE